MLSMTMEVAPDMDIRQLMYFQKVAELEHMTKAAEQLMVSQPFLSRTISALETELGVPLFDHIGRQICLNAYGACFYERMQRVFMNLEDAQRELKDLAQQKDLTVSIITNASLYMPELLSRFRRHIPHTRFHQTSAPRHQISKKLHTGEADFAITSPPLTDDTELETIVLINETCVIIHASNHWLCGRKTVSLHELKDEDFICALPGFSIRDLTDRFFEAAGIQPNIIIESSDTSSIPNYIQNGFGIAFAPLSILSRHPLYQKRCIRHIEVSDPPCVGVVGLTWKKGRYLSASCRHFRDFASGYFDELSRDQLRV